jgi:hypothetical protein
MGRGKEIRTLFLLCEDAVRRWLFASQEEGPEMEPASLFSSRSVRK